MDRMTIVYLVLGFALYTFINNLKSLAERQRSVSIYTDPDELHNIALRSTNKYYRMNVARNRAARVDTLIALSKDPYWCARSVVASRKDCPREILEVLKNDSHFDVRRSAEQSLNGEFEDYIYIN